MKCSASLRGLAAAVVCAAGSIASAAEPEPPETPLGLPPVFWPADNPWSPAKLELGRHLYFDKRLSSDSTIACATCHSPKYGFTDGAPVSTGINDQKGGRSAPTVINRAYSLYQFWDGRAVSLEDQAGGPPANPIEMTNERDPKKAYSTAIARLKKVPEYRKRMKHVFGAEDFGMDHVTKAIATFERTVLSGNAPYDRYKAGDEEALSAAQRRGMNLFFSDRVACDSCHLGFNFSDGSYVNIGIGMDRPDQDLGRYAVSGREEDRGTFKTPTLREVTHTAPYMHDGRYNTLTEVVQHYNGGGISNPWLDERLKSLKLKDSEVADIIEFLGALSGEGWQHITEPEPFPSK